MLKENSMHDVVKLLLTRMESNPDEFYSNGKYARLIEENRRWMSTQEKDLINNALSKIRMGELHTQVMKEIFESGERVKKQNLSDTHLTDAIKHISSMQTNTLGGAKPSKVIASQEMMKSMQSILEEEYKKAFLFGTPAVKKEGETIEW